jgi:hypothetical protein
MRSPGRVQNGPVLVLAPFGRDAGVICSMLAAVGVEAQEKSDLPELVGSLDGAAVAVIAEEAPGARTSRRTGRMDRPSASVVGLPVRAVDAQGRP